MNNIFKNSIGSRQSTSLYFFLIRFPAIHSANGSLTTIRLFTKKKQSEVICLRTEVMELTEVPIYVMPVRKLQAV
jgi:hypothetical protein